MKYVIVNVLGNFGTYNGLMVPTTGRDEDTLKAAELIVNAKYQDTILIMNVIADVNFRK